jgi:uncharacterized phage-like protein YoqJ
MRIAITGHRPDTFLVSHYSETLVQEKISNIIASMKRQFGDKLVFNLGGAIGVDQWAGKACLEQDVKYHLYLPFLPGIQSKYWSEEQKTEYNNQVKKANGITIIDPSGGFDKKTYQLRNIKMVDDAQFVIAFWLGKRIGGTYNCMKYGLSQSKFVLHGLDGLRILFNEDLEMGWTPGDSE